MFWKLAIYLVTKSIDIKYFACCPNLNLNFFPSLAVTTNGNFVFAVIAGMNDIVPAATFRFIVKSSVLLRGSSRHRKARQGPFNDKTSRAIGADCAIKTGVIF